MAKGIVSTYAPAERDAEPAPDQIGLSAEDWLGFVTYSRIRTRLGPTPSTRGHYLRTDGQVYWSRLQPVQPLPPGGRRRALPQDGLGHVRVPRAHRAVRAPAELRGVHGVGQRNSLCQLARTWCTARCGSSSRRTRLPCLGAREDYACIIFNLLVEHSPSELDRSRGRFQALIDCASGTGRLLLPDVPALGQEGPD